MRAGGGADVVAQAGAAVVPGGAALVAGLADGAAVGDVQALRASRQAASASGEWRIGIIGSLEEFEPV